MRSWLPLLGMSLLVLGLLAGVTAFSPAGFSLETLFAWESGLHATTTTQPTPNSSAIPAPAAGGSATLAPIITCTMYDTAVFRQNLTIGEGQRVCGNVDVFGGDLTIQGRVDGNVTITGGTGKISGTVKGDITALDANLILQTGAHIDGSIQTVGGSITRDKTGVYVGGSTQQGIDPQQVTPSHWMGFTGSYDFPWSYLIFWMLAGVALTAIFPRQLAGVRRAARDSLPAAFFIGLLTAILSAIVAVALFLTCLGIPLALLLAAAITVSSVVGTVALGLWLGERLLGQSRTTMRASLLPAVVGVTLLALLQTAPCVGGVITVLTSCAGLGASIMALSYARRHAVWTPDGLL